MAVAWRTGSVGTVANRTTFSFTFSASAQVDDWAICYMESDDDDTCTPPALWTLVADLWNASGCRGQVFRHKILSGEPGTGTGNFTFATATWSQPAIGYFSGADTTNPEDATATENSGASGTTHTANSITTVSADCLIVAIDTNLDGGTHTPPTSMTERAEGNCVSLAEVLQASAGASGNKAFTASPNLPWVAFLIALKPAATGITVTPTTVALVTATFAPTVTASNHITVTPTTLATAITAYAPTVTVATPSTTPGFVLRKAGGGSRLRGGDVLRGPGVDASVTVTPPTANLSLTVWDWGTWGGQTYPPTVTVTQNALAVPDTLSLVLTAFAPTVLTPQTVTPTTASLSLATFAPAVTVGIIVTPSTASLTLTTFAPTVTTPVVVTPATQSLILTAYAPTISTPVLVVPGTLSLVLSAFAPTVATPQTVTPGAASLVLTTFVPTVTGITSLTVTPGTANLVLASFAPTVAISAHVTVTPGVVALSITGLAPTVLTPRLVIPGTLALVTASFVPTVSVTDHILVTPGVASLVLTGFAPTVVVPLTLTPVPATLTLTTFAPDAFLTTVVVPVTASLLLVTFVPVVTASAHVMNPGTATISDSALASAVVSDVLVSGADASDSLVGSALVSVGDF